MKNWLYYTQLALLDIRRLWSAVWPQIVVVSGICLPILLLQGLKRGHVAELRQELLRSPTGRQVEFWSGLQGERIRGSAFPRLLSEIKGIDIIIPHSEHHGTLSRATLAGEKVQVSEVKFLATTPGDPLLMITGADVLTRGERAVVLSRGLAEQLKVAVGEEVELQIQRKDGGSARLPLIVKRLISDVEGDRLGYLDVQVHDWIENYLRGFRVAELGWPAAVAAGDSYSGYLVFCESTNPIKDDGVAALARRNLSIEKVTDQKLCNLYGLLKSQKLIAYYVRGFHSDSDIGRRLREDPEEVREDTCTDSVVIPWNPPQIQTLDGVSHTVIGCSLPKRSWLRALLRDPAWAFEYSSDVLFVRCPFAALGVKNGSRRVLEITNGGEGVRVPVVAADQPDLNGQLIMSASAVLAPLPSLHWGGSAANLMAGLNAGNGSTHTAPSTHDLPLAVVPVNLLAHLDGLKHGAIDFDSVSNQFVPIPGELSYRRARLYCSTIDDVPAVVRQLGERQLLYQSEGARIAEIQKQDESLRAVVLIVGIGVFLFGVFTVLSVLLESTARKRGTIGILRVMGVSRPGIFYLVFIRAAMIGLLAAVLTVTVGTMLEWGLSFLAIKVSLLGIDLAMVFPGALFCCVAGSLYPAWDASRVDPFEAIIEGRFR